MMFDAADAFIQIQLITRLLQFVVLKDCERHLTDGYSHYAQLEGEKQTLRVSCHFARTAAFFLLRGSYQVFFSSFCSAS